MFFRSRRRRVAVVILVLLVGLTLVILKGTEADAEGNLVTEQTDIAEIAQRILTIQARYAAEQHRPIGRGTHTKGVCAAATFEVFDILNAQPDRALASRLAKGIYAKPGTYPATVRFANGQSYIYPDSTPDVRAMSFSVDRASANGAGGARQDFTMNNAPIFPLNDAHEFAVALKVATAPTPAKGIWSLPFHDKLGFTRTALLGRGEQKPATRSYQLTRYWSTVPFQHGATDVIKYSATPCATNTAHPLGSGPNPLQDELVRKLTDDQPVSCFDFSLQLLDLEKMTHWSRRRTAAYWTENASIAWNEEQAPFHNVARLTLVPKSEVAPAACDAMYIDVTRNSTEESKPLGSINRARSSGESASRKARLGR